MKLQRGNSDKKSRVLQFLLASLLLHIFLFVGFHVNNAYRSPDLLLKQKKYEPSVQFMDISENSDLFKGKMVEQDKKKPTEKPKDAKYLSAQDQKVKEETRAATRDEFQNAKSAAQKNPRQKKSAASAVATSAAPDAPASTAENMKMFEGGDMAVPAKAAKKAKAITIADLRPNTSQEMSDAALEKISATPESLKDVAIGADTHLNTKEFLYYTYFTRIKKKLRQHWEPKIHEKVRMLARRGRDLASTQGNKVTRVVITLDEHGVLTRVQVATTSGLEDLDDAAIEALKSAAPFPNPPKDLVIEGLVKINWDFILES